MICGIDTAPDSSLNNGKVNVVWFNQEERSASVHVNEINRENEWLHVFGLVSLGWVMRWAKPLKQRFNKILMFLGWREPTESYGRTCRTEKFRVEIGLEKISLEKWVEIIHIWTWLGCVSLSICSTNEIHVLTLNSHFLTLVKVPGGSTGRVPEFRTFWPSTILQLGPPCSGAVISI